MRSLLLSLLLVTFSLISTIEPVSSDKTSVSIERQARIGVEPRQLAAAHDIASRKRVLRGSSTMRSPSIDERPNNEERGVMDALKKLSGKVKGSVSRGMGDIKRRYQDHQAEKLGQYYQDKFRLGLEPSEVRLKRREGYQTYYNKQSKKDQAFWKYRRNERKIQEAMYQMEQALAPRREPAPNNGGGGIKFTVGAFI